MTAPPVESSGEKLTEHEALLACAMMTRHLPDIHGWDEAIRLAPGRIRTAPEAIRTALASAPTREAATGTLWIEAEQGVKYAGPPCVWRFKSGADSDWRYHVYPEGTGPYSSCAFTPKGNWSAQRMSVSVADLEARLSTPPPPEAREAGRPECIDDENEWRRKPPSTESYIAVRDYALRLESERRELREKLAKTEKDWREYSGHMHKSLTDSHALQAAVEQRLALSKDELRKERANADRLFAETHDLRAQLAAAEAECAAAYKIAGEALGTDPEYHNAGCVKALADRVETLRSDLATERERNAPRTVLTREETLKMIQDVAREAFSQLTARAAGEGK